MDDKQIHLIADALEATQKITMQLAADSSAMYAVIRALADAASRDPNFVSSLKYQIEHRITGQLNSHMTDEQLQAFRDSLKHLLPQTLRDI